MFLPRMGRLLQWRKVACGAALAALVLGDAPVFAQNAANPFLGQWTVEWDGHSKVQVANLEITETGGTWQTVSWARFNPCVGREVPLELHRDGPQTLVMILRFSLSLQGCKDSKVVLRVSDDGKVTGTRGDTELTLKRK